MQPASVSPLRHARCSGRPGGIPGSWQLGRQTCAAAAAALPPPLRTFTCRPPFSTSFPPTGMAARGPQASAGRPAAAQTDSIPANGGRMEWR